MTNIQEIDAARKLLDLKEETTLEEVRKSYRRLSLRYHPDRCKGADKKKCEETFKKINHANRIIMSYCAGYTFSFKEKDIKRNAMDEESYEHLKQFYDGWWSELNL
ncbi:MAG: J domain-containing protein [Candidatus Omnitrophica bacterium]|nr:J domain-containing protein [Candidatus Omnitrophota bacterium]